MLKFLKIYFYEIINNTYFWVSANVGVIMCSLLIMYTLSNDFMVFPLLIYLGALFLPPLMYTIITMVIGTIFFLILRPDKDLD